MSPPQNPTPQNIIKDIHSAVIDNDIETLMERSASVPAVLLSSKDTNGLTPLHKAAGLAHTRILEYLLTAWPDAVTEPDFAGKTPLHWASSAKNNSRAYNLLVQAGADEEALDYVCIDHVKLTESIARIIHCTHYVDDDDDNVDVDASVWHSANENTGPLQAEAQRHRSIAADVGAGRAARSATGTAARLRLVAVQRGSRRSERIE